MQGINIVRCEAHSVENPIAKIIHSALDGPKERGIDLCPECGEEEFDISQPDALVVQIADILPIFVFIIRKSLANVVPAVEFVIARYDKRFLKMLGAPIEERPPNHLYVSQIRDISCKDEHITFRQHSVSSLEQITIVRELQM